MSCHVGECDTLPPESHAYHMLIVLVCFLLWFSHILPSMWPSDDGIVKVGNMRIVQSKNPHVEKQASKEEGKKEGEGEDKPDGETNGEEDTEETTELEKKAKDKITVSGALARGNADFPAEAVKAYHEKPMPSKSSVNHVPVNNVAHHIVHQPRKSTH